MEEHNNAENEWDWDIDEVHTEENHSVSMAVTENATEVEVGDVPPTSIPNVAKEGNNYASALNSSTELVPMVETVNDDSIDDAAGINRSLSSTSVEMVVLPSGQESQALVVPRGSPSRLKFAADEKTVVSQLQDVEEKTLRRKQLMQKEIHNITARLGLVSARMAHERLDRAEALKQVAEEDVVEPLHRMVDDFSLLQDQKSLKESSKLHWRNVERRIEQLDNSMTEAVHIDLPQLRSAISTEYDIEKCVVDGQVELHESDKREDALTRQFDQLAGTMTRRYHEETSTCVAEYNMLAKHTHKLSTDQKGIMDDSEQPQIAMELIKQIRDLRAAVKNERLLRQAKDEHLRQLINQRVRGMKAAILEVHGDTGF